MEGSIAVLERPEEKQEVSEDLIFTEKMKERVSRLIKESFSAVR